THCSRAERATESLLGSGSAYGHGWMLHCPLSIPTYSSLRGGMDRCLEVSSDGSLVGRDVASTTTTSAPVVFGRSRAQSQGIILAVNNSLAYPCCGTRGIRNHYDRRPVWSPRVLKRCL